MRKLIESTLVSLDGVIEAPERWAIFDEEATQRSMQELDNYDAFVMGLASPMSGSARTGLPAAATPTSTASPRCPSTSPRGPSTT